MVLINAIHIWCTFNVIPILFQQIFIDQSWDRCKSRNSISFSFLFFFFLSTSTLLEYEIQFYTRTHSKSQEQFSNFENHVLCLVLLFPKWLKFMYTQQDNTSFATECFSHLNCLYQAAQKQWLLVYFKASQNVYCFWFL